MKKLRQGSGKSNKKLLKAVAKEASSLLSKYRVTADTLTMAYAISKDKALLQELFEKAELRANSCKTEEMRREQVVLLRFLEPTLGSLIAIFETDDEGGPMCNPDGPRCEDPQEDTGGGRTHEPGNALGFEAILFILIIIIIVGAGTRPPCLPAALSSATI